MEVLLISPLPPPIGGIANWTRIFLDYLSRSYPEIKIVHLDTRMRKLNITNQNVLLRIFYGIKNSRNILIELQELLLQNNIDIIHLTSSASLALIKDYFIIHAAQKLKIPVIIHWRFGRIPYLYEKNNIEWKLVKYIVKICSNSIVLDSSSYSSLWDSGLRNIVKIPNPIDINSENIESSYRDREGFKRIKGRIVFVGHITEKKGAFDLVKACLNVEKVKELVLIGPIDKKIKDDLKRIASKRLNGAWLSIEGPKEKKYVLELMRSSYFLVLPSYTEGFPNVILESMYMGCCVIASSVGAIPEMLAIDTSSPCGICIPPGNVEFLKNVIIQVIYDSKLANEMGKNGKLRVLKEYNFDKVSHQYIDIWYEAHATSTAEDS